MGKYPALTFFFIFSAGILFGFFFFQHFALPYSFLVPLLLSGIITAVFKIKKDPYLLLLTVFYSGLILMQYRIHSHKCMTDLLLPWTGKNVVIEGNIDHIIPSEENNKAIIKVESIKCGSVKKTIPGLRLYCFFPEGSTQKFNSHTPLSVRAKIYPFPVLRPGSLSLFSRGIKGSVYVRKGTDITLFSYRNETSFLQKIILFTQKRLKKTLSAGFSSPSARSIYLALILGQRKDLSEDIQTLFKKTGTFHVFSISGLHFATVVFSFIFLLNLLPLNKRQRFVMIVVFSLFYLFLTEARISSIRAFVMLMLFFLSKEFYRDYKTLNALGLCGLLFLICDPFSLFTAGFQLSFSAVLGLATLHQWLIKKIDFTRPQTPLDKLKPFKWYHRPARKILTAFSVCLSAWLFTIPPLLFHFREFSPIASLINLFVVPLVYMIIQLGVFSSLIGVFLPFLSLILNLFAERIILFMLSLVHFFHSLFPLSIQGDRIATLLWTAAAAAFISYYLYREHKITEA